MVAFDLWGESFIFASIFSVIILIPCLIIGILGRKMIVRLSYYPSQAPQILMSICVQFFLTAIFAFALLFGFFKMFTD